MGEQPIKSGMKAPLTDKSVTHAPPGRHRDGKGLYLLVKPKPGSPEKGGAKSWVLRVQVDGQRRDIGLGTYAPPRSAEAKRIGADEPEIEIPLLQRKMLSLAEAREKALLLRTAAKSGLDPVAERDRDRKTIPTFKAAAHKAHEALKKGWAKRGADTFINSLTTHVFPTMGDKRVDLITAADIIEALDPIWMTKVDMARKVRHRISTVLNFAHSRGWRPSEAPSKSVTVGLSHQPKGGNYRAMPYSDVPSFVQAIQAKAETVGRQALLFQIFTAARPGEVRNARWGQIDFAKRDWNRPAEIMKGKDADPHTVTLNDAAIALLKHVKAGREVKADDLIFVGQRGGKLSDMTMSKVLRTGKYPYDAHGFRSSFRDWAAEKMPRIPDPVAEAALAHSVADKVIAAYKRTKFPEMRRKLLAAWGSFVTSGADSATKPKAA